MSFKLYSLYEIKSSIDLGELGCFLRLSCGIWEIRHEQKNVFFYIYIQGVLTARIFYGKGLFAVCVYEWGFFLKASTKTPL